LNSSWRERERVVVVVVVVVVVGEGRKEGYHCERPFSLRLRRRRRKRRRLMMMRLTKMMFSSMSDRGRGIIVPQRGLLVLLVLVVLMMVKAVVVHGDSPPEENQFDGDSCSFCSYTGYQFQMEPVVLITDLGNGVRNALFFDFCSTPERCIDVDQQDHGSMVSWTQNGICTGWNPTSNIQNTSYFQNTTFSQSTLTVWFQFNCVNYSTFNGYTTGTLQAEFFCPTGDEDDEGS